MKPRVLLSSIDDEERARQLARRWIDEGLAACVQIVPGVVSTYRWAGAVEVSDELSLIIKFACPDGELRNRIERMKGSHPYDEPEFVALSVDDVSPGYLAWMIDSTRRSDAGRE